MIFKFQYFTLFIAGEYLELSTDVLTLVQLLVSTSTARQLLRRLFQCASDIQHQIWNQPDINVDLQFFRTLFGKHNKT